MLPNLTLIAAVVGALLQAGAQLFAIAVVVATVTKAPPRSLAMYAGEYGYNSGPFWEVMPTVTLVLLLIALVGNWRTPRRRLVLTGVALFIAAGLFTVFVMGPAQDAVVRVGYSDAVDEALRVQAGRWHMLDWASWVLTLSVGVVLAASLAVRVPEATAARDVA
jgi:ABC-type Fe3+-siderophore transport system permease subunit